MLITSIKTKKKHKSYIQQEWCRWKSWLWSLPAWHYQNQPAHATLLVPWSSLCHQRVRLSSVKCSKDIQCHHYAKINNELAHKLNHTTKHHEQKPCGSHQQAQRLHQEEQEEREHELQDFFLSPPCPQSAHKADTAVAAHCCLSTSKIKLIKK